MTTARDTVTFGEFLNAYDRYFAGDLGFHELPYIGEKRATYLARVPHGLDPAPARTMPPSTDALNIALADLERDPDAFEPAVEDQYTISRWADDTFGPVGSNISVAQRARKEFDKLYRALEENDWHPKAAEEVADVVIILYRLAGRLGVDLHAEIDRKMAVNRGRTWLLDGNGHGQHVEEEET